jgi:hypothetical protein
MFAAAACLFLASSIAHAQSLRQVADCTIRPGTLCADMNLNGADFFIADLAQARMPDAKLCSARTSAAPT